MAELLVVEDDDDLRESLEILLTRRGYQVVTAANGRDALERLQTGASPCLIVLDLMMPVMDGWEFRARLLEDERLARVPIVLLSGVGDLVREASALSAVAHLVKPVDLPKLYELVKAHC